jgi:hypothetical protein
MERVGLALPAPFIRLDDSTLYDIADGRSDNGVPPKGLAVRLGERRRSSKLRARVRSGDQKDRS